MVVKKDDEARTSSQRSNVCCEGGRSSISTDSTEREDEGDRSRTYEVPGAGRVVEVVLDDAPDVGNVSGLCVGIGDHGRGTESRSFEIRERSRVSEGLIPEGSERKDD